MTIELRPFGVNCNLSCRYCYQLAQRQVDNYTKEYSMDAMKKTLEKEGGPFSLFGGEALLVPEKDLEEIFAWGYKQYRRNSIQTNGTLINENHIKIVQEIQCKSRYIH